MFEVTQNIDLISERLNHPPNEINIDDLIEHWFVQMIKFRISGAGISVKHPRLQSWIKGAWGRQLMEGASKNALNEAPCTWSPPCALSIFQISHYPNSQKSLTTNPSTSKKKSFPKPYLILCENDNGDLIVNLQIFGFATEWSLVASHCMASALSHNIDWYDLGISKRVNPSIISHSITMWSPPSFSPASEDEIELHFISPLIDERKAILEKPKLILQRLTDRIQGLLGWHESILSNSEISDIYNYNNNLDASLLKSITLKERHRKGAVHQISAVSGRLIFPNKNKKLEKLLVIGTSCGIGKGAVKGYGQYKLY